MFSIRRCFASHVLRRRSHFRVTPSASASASTPQPCLRCIGVHIRCAVAIQEPCMIDAHRYSCVSGTIFPNLSFSIRLRRQLDPSGAIPLCVRHSSVTPYDLP